MNKRWSYFILILISLVVILESRPLWLQFKSLSHQSPLHLQEARAPSALNHPVISPSPHSEACKDFHTLVCQKRGELTDPTGSVRSDVEGEKNIVKMYKEIIRAHLDWTSEQVDEALVAEIYTPKQRDRIESAFRWVRHTLEHFIDAQSDLVFNLQEKHLIKARLRKTKLQLPPPASVYSDEPDLLTKNEAYYERTPEGDTRLRVGGAYVYIAKSWFNLIYTLAHELAHSIDPCEMKVAGHSFPAYKRLTSCFMKIGLIALRKNRLECGANDQMSEIFADWVAAEVLGSALGMYATEFHGQQILNSASNSVRDLCDPDDDATEFDLELHPSSHIRIQRVFGDHPTIRALLGCTNISEQPSYCTFETTLPIPVKDQPLPLSQGDEGKKL